MERRFTIQPGNSIRNVQLGFYATSAVINNPSAYWYHMPEQGQYIQPYASNLVVPLIGTQTATVLFEAPVGISQAISGDNSPLTIVYTDQPLAPTAGYGGYSGVDPGTNLSQLFTLVGTSNRAHQFPYPLRNGFGVYIPLDSANIIGSFRVEATLPIGVTLPTIMRHAINWPFAAGQPPTTIQIRYGRPLPAQTVLRIFWREQGGGIGNLRYAIAT